MFSFTNIQDIPTKMVLVNWGKRALSNKHNLDSLASLELKLADL